MKESLEDLRRHYGLTPLGVYLVTSPKLIRWFLRGVAFTLYLLAGVRMGFAEGVKEWRLMVRRVKNIANDLHQDDEEKS